LRTHWGFAERLRRSADEEDAVGRSQEAERDNDVSVVLNRCGIWTSTDAYLCRRPGLPAKAGR